MHADESERDEREQDERERGAMYDFWPCRRALDSHTRKSRSRQREWRGNWRGVVIGKNTYVSAIMAKNPDCQDL